MSTRNRTEGHDVGTPTERTSLLSFRPRTWSGSSSSENFLTIPSLDSSSSDSQFIPWYLDPPGDPERGVPRYEAVPAAPDGKKRDWGHGPILRAISILIVGVFTGNADGSLVLATHSTIASEFNNLAASGWLMTAFALAGASFQNISGQLSDIFGRRPILTVSYVLFAAGCALVGVGQFMWQVVLGRAISGAGSSALGVVAALLISDLVPLRDVAAWQAGLNLAATTGRSLGGPVGGWLADTVGWRWSFAGQAPIFLVAAFIGWFILPKGPPALPMTDQSETPEGHNAEETVEAVDNSQNRDDTTGSLLSRIDFLGAGLLALTILSILIPVDLAGKTFPWTHPLILFLFASALLFGGLFLATEAWWTTNPVFPLSLFRDRNVIASYAITACQIAAQLGLMFSVPIYFQVSQRVSNARAGAYLFPAVFGNAVGAVLAGLIIKRTGRYKPVLLFGTLASSFSYALLFFTWHGNTSPWEALYIAPSGFGTGIAQTAVFTSIQASINKKQRAPALAGMYLTMQIGLMIGLVAVGTTVMETVRWKLDVLLRGLDLGPSDRTEIIHKAASDIDYLDKVGREVYSAIVESYMLGLTWSHLVSIGFCGLAFVAACCLREVKL